MSARNFGLGHAISGSAIMNAFAFSAQTSGWMTGAAVVLGLATPALIYALTRIGGAMYIDNHNKRGGRWENL